MGIMEKSLRSLFPPGWPWKLTGLFGDIVDALSLSLDRVRTFLFDIIAESNPGTAEDTLESWFEQLRLKYDATQTLDTLQSRARQAYGSIGGQDLDYLNDRIQTAYPDVEIIEYLVNVQEASSNMVGIGMVGQMMVQSYPSWLSTPPTDGSYPVYRFRVSGEVDDITDFNGLQNIIDRLKPATHVAEYEVTIRNQTATAEVGLAMVGLAQVGRTKEDA